MKVIIIVFLLFFGWRQSAAQSRNCRAYQTGTFKLIEVKNAIHFKIERTATRQIEYDLNKGTYLSFSINWLNDCEYELRLVDGNSEMTKFFKSKVLIMKILETFSDGYQFEAHVKGEKLFRTYFLRTI